MKNLVLMGLILASCMPKDQALNVIDIQGHRGARGLAPENSIPAFILAADMGVNTLELDLVVSKDSHLVVSHEPFFSSDFCLDSDGIALPKDSIINMYQLTYEEIMRFDCGSIRNPGFPKQKRIPSFKPLLSDVIDSVESFMRNKGLEPLRYNIRIENQERDRHCLPSVTSSVLRFGI